MKLRQLTIHNFRAIRDASVEIHDYALLVGANNAGKSTIVDCIRAVYEKDKYKFSASRDFPQGETADKESWAEIEFQLEEEEAADLAEKYLLEGNRLRLRKIFKTDAAGYEDGSLYGYLKSGELEASAFYGAKGVQNGKIGDVIYIPAVSTVDEHTKLSGPSALRDLLTDLLSSVIEGSEPYKHFGESYSTFVAEVRSAKDGSGRSLSDFERELDDSLEDWNAGFSMQFRPPSAQDLVKSLIGWDLLDEITKKQSQPGNFGSGFQRHFIFSLISIGAKFAKQAPKKKAKDFTPALRLLLFEEPEAFLHPPQQNVLSQQLRTLAEKEGWQVMCSTHSPHFVSRRSEEITAVVRLAKTHDVSRAFQITADDWKNLLDARHELTAIFGEISWLTEEEKESLEVLRYFLWLNPDRSGLFFAEMVLLVEGHTEVGVLQRMIDRGVLKANRRGCYVLNCEGKFNMHRFMRLLTALGIHHAVLYDDDDDRGVHANFNKLLELTQCKTFTRGLLPIKGCLEKYLEMPEVPNKGERLKPFLAIHRWENGQFSQEALKELCVRLEPVLD